MAQANNTKECVCVCLCVILPQTENLQGSFERIALPKPGVATLFVLRVEKQPQKICRPKNVSEKAYRAKFRLVKTHNRFSLTFQAL